MPSNTLFLFRRDLRLSDNTALNEALRKGDSVLAVFILDRKLLDRWKTSTKRLSFLFQSLRQLQERLEALGGSLLVATAREEDLLPSLFKKYSIDTLFVNKGYSIYGRMQDKRLEQIAGKSGKGFFALDDAHLNAPEQVLKADGSPYTIFTPYFRKASTFLISGPAALEKGRFLSLENKGSWPSELDRYLGIALARFEPGERGALKALNAVSGLTDYEHQRDVPASEQTSHLSAHMRFGTCSVRQAHHAVRKSLNDQHPLLRQLYWRDFYHQIGWHYPHVFKHAFRRH